MTYDEIIAKLEGQAAKKTGQEALKMAYLDGVADTIQEFKDAGITDLDLGRWDFDLDIPELEFTEEDLKVFERMEQEMQNMKLDPEG